MDDRLHGGNLLQALLAVQEIKLHEEDKLLNSNLIRLAVLGDGVCDHRLGDTLGGASRSQHVVDE